MAISTIGEIIQRTIKQLHQVQGTGVQIYAEDIIAEHVIATFNLVFDEVWWDGYMEWYERVLDGVDGVVTEVLEGVRRFEDVRAVFADGSDRPLPLLPRDFNPFGLDGSMGLFIEALPEDAPSKIIQFWPKTATSTVAIHARKQPKDFYPETVLKVDADLLVYGAGWDYLEADGTVPAQASKMQVKFEARLKQIKKLYSSKPIALDPRHGGPIPLEWWAR